MKLMLACIFLWIALGLLAPRFGMREKVAAALLATAMTLLYYRFGARFM